MLRPPHVPRARDDPLPLCRGRQGPSPGRARAPLQRALPRHLAPRLLGEAVELDGVQHFTPHGLSAREVGVNPARAREMGRDTRGFGHVLGLGAYA